MVSRTARTAEKIRALEIQGANAIAKAALEALAADMAEDPASDRKGMFHVLASSRPNEPMLRNLLDAFLASVGDETSGQVDTRALRAGSSRRSPGTRRRSPLWAQDLSAMA